MDALADQIYFQPRFIKAVLITLEPNSKMPAYSKRPLNIRLEYKVKFSIYHLTVSFKDERLKGLMSRGEIGCGNGKV